MRLLFLAPGVRYTESYPFELRGSESQMIGLGNELRKCGHETTIVGQFGDASPQDAARSEGPEFLSVSVARLPGTPIGDVIRGVIFSRKALPIIRRVGPDAICLNERFSATFVSRLSTPKVFITHNPDAMPFYRSFAVSQNRTNILFFDLKRLIEESVMSRCNSIVALTDRIKGYLSSRGFPRITVIPNAVDEDQYRNAGDENFILYAGRLARVKGVDILIEAFAGLTAFRTHFLTVIGSGPEEARLHKLAARLGVAESVRFLPLLPREGLRRYLSTCSVFVLPSLYEGMPVTLLEAMASGKSVIASDIPGPADIIQHGSNGLLFESGSVESLRERLTSCLSDSALRNRIGASARRSVEAKYSFRQTARLYLQTFRTILGDD